MFNYNGELAAGYLEADLITDMFEASMIDIMNIQDIQDEYMTESSSDGTNKIKDFFNKIWEKIKSLFEKLKKAILDKIANAKIKAEISKIKKAGIKDTTKIAAKGSRSDKELTKYINKWLKVVTVYQKKLAIAKTLDECNRLIEKMNDEMGMIATAFDAASPKTIEFSELSYTIINPTNIMDQVTDRVGKIQDDIGRIMADRYDKLSNIELGDLKDTEIKKVVDEKKAIEQGSKKAGSALSSLASKLGNIITKHKMASIAALSALAASVSVATIKIGDKIRKNNFNKAVNQSLDEFQDLIDNGYFESTSNADDTIDSLMDDMINNI